MKTLISLAFLVLASGLSAQTCQLHKQHADMRTGSQDPEVMASNLRSDTVDILHFTINLNITDFTGKIITGNTMVKFTPKISGVTQLRLDLLELIIDSVEI